MLRSCIRPPSEEKIRSKMIDKELAKNIDFQKAIKILLLGTGESGKTTIIKQMKILHINGFTEEERREKGLEIRQNIHESMYTLCTHMKLLNLDYDSKPNQQIAAWFLSLGDTYLNTFPKDYYRYVNEVWQDSGVRECYRRSNEFQLIDSAKYFLDKIDIVSDPNFSPTTEDILHSRKITTGIHEITFNVEIPKKMGGGLQEFRMFDVGGQRDQRNKWMQVFDGIEVVLFIISCADFDQTLRESEKDNRLLESIRLFSLVWHNRFLMTAGLIVFLNKQDIMEEKIKQGKRVGNFFPDYENFRVTPKDGNVFDEAIRTRCFIRQKLVDITKEPPRRISTLEVYKPRDVFYHFTIATDTNNISTVFNDVRSFIISTHINEFSML